VLRPRDDDAELLMLRRATHETDPWSGQIALPGGRREPTDASLLQTAIRETREETTLDLADVPVLGALDELRPRTPSLPPFVVRPYVFVVQDVPALTQSVEVAELFWAPLGRLFDARHAARSDVHPQGLRMTVDAIDFDGRIIWGMTERILRSFQHVLSTI
jgi:8-oxo-dGTP pyrophosphatase MutT (NUDIX family)